MRRGFKKLTAFLMSAVMILPFFTEYPEETFDIDWNLNLSADAVSALTVRIYTGNAVTLKDKDNNGYYDIGTADELYAFAAIVNGGNTNVNAELKTNIRINEGEFSIEKFRGTPKYNGNHLYDNYGNKITDVAHPIDWIPIGSESNKYTGKFNGNNFTISGLFFNENGKGTIEDKKDYGGFFKYIKNAEIKNVGIIDSWVGAGDYIGAVCGYNEGGIIKNCYSKSDVVGTKHVGGICGYNDGGTIDSCYNKGIVYGTQLSSKKEENLFKVWASEEISGVCGTNYGMIKNCYNAGYVNGTKRVGGVCGQNNKEIEGCYNKGKVIGESATSVTAIYLSESVGGVCGYNSRNCTIRKCYNAGTEVSGQVNIGGVCGFSDGEISNCYNTGYVAGVSAFNMFTEYKPLRVAGVCAHLGGCGVMINFFNNSSSPFNNLCAQEDGKLYNAFFNATINGHSPYIPHPEDYAGRTAEQFANGEITYILQSSNAEQVWGQDITTGENDTHTDAGPVLGGPKVYKYEYTSCNGVTQYRYSNQDLKKVVEEHNFSGDGILCENCGNYREPAKNGDVYQISGASNLMWFAKQVNSGNKTINAELIADIDMTGIVWTAMNKYAGTFDGNGYTIKGLCKNAGMADTKRCGLIQNLESGGKVTNLIIHEADLWAISSVGAIAAKNYGTISMCIVKDSTIMLGAKTGHGAVAGENYGTIENCEVINCFLQRRYGAANSAEFSIGSIAEFNEGTIRNCFSYGCRFSNTPNPYAITANGNAPVECCYYTASGVLDADAATKLTAEQVAAGAAAYILQGTQIDETWGQDITTGENDTETDALPVWNGPKVYRYGDVKCSGEVIRYHYSNEEKQNIIEEHSVPDGEEFCTKCGGRSVPKLVDGVYQIENASNMMWFANEVNSGNTTINAKLMADINITQMNWSIMGSYAGTFDGNNHIIYGLNGHADYNINSVKGFINVLESNGIVKNLTFDKAFVFNNETTGSSVIASTNKGRIENCVVSNSIVQLGAYHRMGVIVGENKGTIINCASVSNTIHRRYSSSNAVCGFVWVNSGTIENCYNYGCTYLSGTEHYAFTQSNKGTIKNCCYYASETLSDTVAASMTAEQFAGGEAAYILGNPWGQTVSGENAQTYPVLNGAKLYRYEKKYCDNTSQIPVVYGYANTEHEDTSDTHKYSYTAQDNVITAECENESCNEKYTVELNVPGDDGNTQYNGNPQEATVKVTSEGAIEAPAIIYEALDENGTLTNGKPVNAGNYKAVITVEEVSAEVEFKIKKADSTVNPVFKTDDLYEGDALPEISLSEDDTAGIIKWTTEGVLKSFENILEWMFTPESENYAAVTGTAVVNAKETTTTTTTVSTTVTTTTTEETTSAEQETDAITATIVPRVTSVTKATTATISSIAKATTKATTATKTTTATESSTAKATTKATTSTKATTTTIGVTTPVLTTSTSATTKPATTTKPTTSTTVATTKLTTTTETITTKVTTTTIGVTTPVFTTSTSATTKPATTTKATTTTETITTKVTTTTIGVTTPVFTTSTSATTKPATTTKATTSTTVTTTKLTTTTKATTTTETITTKVTTTTIGVTTPVLTTSTSATTKPATTTKATTSTTVTTTKLTTTTKATTTTETIITKATTTTIGVTTPVLTTSTSATTKPATTTKATTSATITTTKLTTTSKVTTTTIGVTTPVLTTSTSATTKPATTTKATTSTTVTTTKLTTTSKATTTTIGVTTPVLTTSTSATTKPATTTKATTSTTVATTKLTTTSKATTTSATTTTTKATTTSKITTTTETITTKATTTTIGVTTPVLTTSTSATTKATETSKAITSTTVTTTKLTTTSKVTTSTTVTTTKATTTTIGVTTPVLTTSTSVTTTVTETSEVTTSTTVASSTTKEITTSPIITTSFRPIIMTSTTTSVTTSATQTTVSQTTVSQTTTIGVTTPVITSGTVTSETTTQTTAITTTTITDITEAKLGDSNGDGKLNVRDCATIAVALAKGEVDKLPASADFNGDGKINVRDAAAIAKRLASSYAERV